MTWRMLDVFSGIGGFSLAASWVWPDLEIVSFVEINPFCQKVLKHHWPSVPIIGDVRDVALENAEIKRLQRRGYREQGFKTESIGLRSTRSSEYAIDLLTGGFPCQPASCAGKRKGREDNRWLWPEMLRVIQEIHPRWVLAENVLGLTSLEGGMVFEHCCVDLENAGYKVQPLILPACGQNAPHRRDRVWLVANSINRRCSESGKQGGMGEVSERRSHIELQAEKSGQDVADTTRIQPGREEQRTVRKRVGECGESTPTDSFIEGLEIKQCQSENNGEKQPSIERNGYSGSWWESEPAMGELVNGVSCRLVRFRGRVARGVPNRVNRLKALGNSIVPQVAFQIMKAIKEVEAGVDSQKRGR